MTPTGPHRPRRPVLALVVGLLVLGLLALSGCAGLFSSPLTARQEEALASALRTSVRVAEARVGSTPNNGGIGYHTTIRIEGAPARSAADVEVLVADVRARVADARGDVSSARIFFDVPLASGRVKFDLRHTGTLDGYDAVTPLILPLVAEVDAGMALAELTAPGRCEATAEGALAPLATALLTPGRTPCRSTHRGWDGPDGRITVWVADAESPPRVDLVALGDALGPDLPGIGLTTDTIQVDTVRNAPDAELVAAAVDVLQHVRAAAKEPVTVFVSGIGDFELWADGSYTATRGPNVTERSRTLTDTVLDAVG